MRYLLPLLLAFVFIGCDEPVPATGDEPRDPLIDSAEKYNRLFHENKKNDLAFASVYAELGLAYSLKADYDQGIADGNANIGYVHFIRQELPQGLISLTNAVDQYTVFNDSSGIANCSHTMGNVYLMMQKYDSAMLFANRALELHRALNMHEQISSDLKTIGFVHTETGKFDSAVAVFKRRVSFEEQSGDSLEVARALSDLAGVYVASGEAETGLNYRIAALNKLGSNGIDSASYEVLKFKARLLNKMAADYFLQNDQGKSIKTAQEGFVIARQINARREKLAAYKTVAELYGLMGSEDVQLQWLDQYILLNDSLLNEETQSRVAAEKMKYAFASNEKELAEQKIKELNDQLVTQEEECSTRTMLMWILISTLLVVTLGAVIYAKKQSKY